MTADASRRILRDMSLQKAILASAKKRTKNGVVMMKCATCGKEMRVWKSKIKLAKLPINCGKECRRVSMLGNRNARYKGGRWTEARTGYVFLKVEELSAEDKALLPPTNPRDVPEHRMVMARALGRWPKTSESIHHINGIPDDNRLENLSVMDWAEHSREHRQVLRRMAALETENKALRAELKRLREDGRAM